MTATTVETETGVDGTKFKSIMLVSIYRWARVGLSEASMIQELKISKRTWQGWKARFPSIRQAIKMGKTETEDGGNWHKYIYDRLAPDLQEIWDNINSWDEEPNGVTKIEALLNNHGKQVRQQLYLHALINTNFSPSRSMRKVCIDKDTLEYWINNDPGFAELVEQIQWHKDNFFEEKLISLVQAGSEAATLHVAKSRLRDRGYGLKSEVDVRHSGSIEHNFVDLTELKLSPEVRRVILEAIRERDQQIEAQKARAMQPVETKALIALTDEIARPVEEAID